MCVGIVESFSNGDFLQHVRSRQFKAKKKATLASDAPDVMLSVTQSSTTTRLFNRLSTRNVEADLMSTFTLVLGTRNKKKRRELEYLLEPYPQIGLSSLDDFPDAIEVEEIGTTFEANAILKATGQAKHLRQWVLGEDSGISVEALGGEPGVYSARFSGPNATDKSNNRLLLERLEGVPAEKRTAWYTCHMALSDPDGDVRINCTDRCYGRILDREYGSAGFGYDPMFLVREYGQTFGQLGDAVKSVLSHRARANRRFVPQLLSLLRQQPA